MTATAARAGMVTLFLAGDVMTGRGIDQILPHPSDPTLHEPGARDARDYVALAERRHGTIERPASPAYPWGEALEILAAARPDARIVNLETAVTSSDDWCRGKEIHYRMHPANVACLTAARLDVTVLANNHTLDWGRDGLLETLAAVEATGIRTAGAGRNLAAAVAPAVVELASGCRVAVHAVASPTAGVPTRWAASESCPGLAFIPELSAAAADALTGRIATHRRPGDLAIVSIHWGTNWGHDVPGEFVSFAHRLIDGGADLVHGHSSHHVRPLEVYRGRLVLYGCGDLVTDYEGISGHEPFRPDLGLLWFATLEAATGQLVRCSLSPVRARRLSLRRASAGDRAWLESTLSRSCGPFGCGITAGPEDSLEVRW